MAVSMEQVRAALDPEEPDYSAAADLGPEAVPHLRTLVAGEDPMLASKAAYLASLIATEEAAEVVRAAAERSEPAVRVAAAAATRNLPDDLAEEVLQELVVDADAGVRKVARSAVPEEHSDRLQQLLEQAPAAPKAAPAPEAAPAPPPAAIPEGQGMPGESGGAGMPGEGPGTMPGEAGGRMPGEAP